MPWFKYSNGTFFKVRIRTFWSSHSSTLTRLLTDFGRIFFKILLVGSFSFGIFLWLLLLSQQTFVGLQDVLKTSSIRLQRNIFTSSKTSWRRLEEVFKTSRKTSWRRLGRQKIVTLKTPWRHILKTFSRLLEGKQNVYWWYLHLTNLNVYLTKLCFTNLYLTDLRRIQNALSRTR